MQKIKQQQLVLDYIEENGSITLLEAIKELGVMRLASRISDLKKAGYPVRRSMEGVKNRFGDKCYIARYSMEGSEGNGGR